ncbi:MAG: hypothetical protein EGQ58_06260 [Phocaeicola dorei]|uniref:Uncharacterized protein n=2 Tax=Phocaeicola dorei TaxID=357276 RepID=A0A1Y4PDS2_9BACT|nr:hypothetical protein BACDOR_01230 [Phocaeicola dorei DSM 17855]EEZ20059.1 hypothetical protein HMPREF0105_3764 [Bacteroides sp. 3_1_33FAA]KAA5290728.1 hypothetical protein F2Z06_13060 [Phocaeicola dorei]RGD23969.1 hypothetical protein DW646_17255 [Bacteroides sp. AM23-18]RGD32425.1 hypothetical protein DW230_19425 [Bacteroides sp. AM18-9]RGP20372.1 hypothetical protein DW034_14480 [Bacteroides sp. AF39-10AT]RJU69861.1 hypothetical protein DW750_14155 [Bacteroides sp. AM28-6]RJV41908.1 hyp
MFIFINLNKQRINIRKDTSYIIVSCLEMTILYLRMSRNRLQTRKKQMQGAGAPCIRKNPIKTY